MFSYPWHASARTVKGYRPKSFPPDRLSPFSKSRFFSYYDTVSKDRGLRPLKDSGELFDHESLKTKGLSQSAQTGGSGLTLHFDELSVLNLSKEAMLPHPGLERWGFARSNGCRALEVGSLRSLHRRYPCQSTKPMFSAWRRSLSSPHHAI